MTQVMFVVQGFQDKERRPDIGVLEQLVEEQKQMTYYCSLRSTAALICGMDHKAYGKMFKVILNQNKSNYGEQPCTVDGYYELSTAIVPEAWKTWVQKIHLLSGSSSRKV